MTDSPKAAPWTQDHFRTALRNSYPLLSDINEDLVEGVAAVFARNLAAALTAAENDGVETSVDEAAQGARLLRAVCAIHWQSGVPVETIVHWLCEESWLCRLIIDGLPAAAAEYRKEKVANDDVTAAAQARRSLPFRPGDIVEHRKGGRYRVEGVGTIEKTMTEAYAYRGHDDRLWFRPIAEMEDGRFKKVGHEPSADDGAPMKRLFGAVTRLFAEINRAGPP
jgi:hypothetical protein